MCGEKRVAAGGFILEDGAVREPLSEAVAFDYLEEAQVQVNEVNVKRK